MARSDISFLDDTTEQVEMPLVITGTCSGSATLMQKVTTLLLADESDATRNYGGSLGDLLSGANVQDEDFLKNYFQQAGIEVYSLLQEEYSLEIHDLPDDEVLTGLTVSDVTLSDNDSVSVTYTITTLDGESTDFNVNIPINIGE